MLDTLASQSALVATIVAVATLIALLLRSKQASTVRFAAFAFAVGAYHAAGLAAALAEDASLLVSPRIGLGAAVVVTASTFFDAILSESGPSARRRRARTFLLCALLTAAGFTPLSNEPGAVAVVGLTLVGLLLQRLFAILRRAARIDSAAERTRLRYVGIGGIVAVVGALFDLGALLGVGTPAIGGLVVALFLYFLSQALQSSRLLDLHELLGKVLVFGSLALILAVVYGFLFLWIGDRRGFFLTNTLIASSLILILFEPLKVRLEETATRVFFREEVTFARSLRALVQRLQTTIELPQAIAAVLDDVHDSKRTTHASIYLLEQGGLGFVRQEHRGPAPASIVDGKTHPALVAHLLRAQTPLLREALARKLGEARNAQDGAIQDGVPAGPLAQETALLRGLDALRADLVLPLRVQGNVIGFFCLRDERLPDAYASDEIAALMEVADQLAINVENSRLFGLLRERDRLAALGEMSAGLAHEIRNPLAAIKGAAQELDPKKVGADNGDLLEIIVDEVNRLNSVVSEFLDYARPFRGTFIALNVNDAVKRTAQLMQHDLGEAVRIELEQTPDLPDVNGDAERLQQVLINLVLNAADAMNRKGRITIATRVTAGFPDAALLGLRTPLRFVEILVRDEGPGIPAHLVPQIFIPFFTTKERGTGLGLALCQRIVQHHGGQLEVRSGGGDGAVFVIRLPALPQARRETAEPSSTAAPSTR